MFNFYLVNILVKFCIVPYAFLHLSAISFILSVLLCMKPLARLVP